MHSVYTPIRHRNAAACCPVGAALLADVVAVFGLAAQVRGPLTSHQAARPLRRVNSANSGAVRISRPSAQMPLPRTSDSLAVGASGSRASPRGISPLRKSTSTTIPSIGTGLRARSRRPGPRLRAWPAHRPGGCARTVPAPLAEVVARPRSLPGSSRAALRPGVPAPARCAPPSSLPGPGRQPQPGATGARRRRCRLRPGTIARARTRRSAAWDRAQARDRGNAGRVAGTPC